MVTREQLNERGRGFLPGLIGLEIVEVAPGKVAARLALRPELRECVLDIGTRAGRHGTGCRDSHRPVGGARSTRRKRLLRRCRRGRLPPVGTLPTSSTHSLKTG